MQGIITNVGCTNCSFLKVFNITAKYFKKLYDIDLLPSIFGHGKLNIGDCLFFLKYYNIIDDNLVVWCDTHFEGEVKHINKKFIVVTTSKWNAEQLARTDYILPRPVDEEFIVHDAKHDKYEFIVVGSEPVIELKNLKTLYSDTYVINNKAYFNRKRIRDTHNLLKQLNVRNKSLFITNVEGIYDMKATTLEESELHQKYASSRFLLTLSRSEGFYMPMAEAMCDGTPLVYIGGHAIDEYAVGIRIKARRQKGIMYFDGTEANWVYDEKDAIDAIKYAMGMGKEEYNDLSEKARAECNKFHTTNIVRVLYKLLDFK